MVRTLLRFSLVSGLLALLVSCIEDFERLTTTVVYDPVTRTLRVERVLHNLDASFFACADPASCVEAAGKMARLDVADPPAPAEEPAPVVPTDALELPAAPEEPSWKTLAKGLVESAAYDIAVTFRRDGDKLDAVVTYGASIDSKAASDAGVALETLRRKTKVSEYLVVDAGKSLGGMDSKAPPTLVAPTQFTERTMHGEEPHTWWVLAPSAHTSTVERFIDESAQPIFLKVPGLDEAMRGAGLL